MELRQLRYFVAVAEELHFGRAAERLDVVQPAVSQQVARLERELGVRLLERTSRRVALTGDGTRLLAEARAALAAADRVRAVAADLAAGRTGTLRMGTSPGLADRLHRGVATLHRTAPDLGLTLVEGSPQAHCAAVRAGELDLALGRGAVRGPGLHAVELWREPLHAVLPADGPTGALPVAALAGMVLRLPERAADPTLHDTVLAACHDAGFTPRLGRPVRSVEATVVEIGAGEGEVTIVYGTPAALTPAVALRPLDPPLDVPGHLVAPATGTPECLAALTAAFC
ncbi:LysR family transcriptional regulator [Pseudonocardia lacus]|uniref:LysR family transcriptional regulator n=1 Tax=Pseudonocardia lacus TaxID=2835865 RepID=UPI001BDCF73E|nr:LysR family transcriptional regulator [Pseudonocardia lacus]